MGRATQQLVRVMMDGGLLCNEGHCYQAYRKESKVVDALGVGMQLEIKHR